MVVLKTEVMVMVVMVVTNTGGFAAGYRTDRYHGGETMCSGGGNADDGSDCDSNCC